MFSLDGTDGAHNFLRRDGTVHFLFSTARDGTFLSSTGRDMHVCPPEHGKFHVITEAGNENLCGVVGCFSGEKPPSREVGPPEQSQRNLPRAFAQPRPAAAPKKNRDRRKHGFLYLFSSQTTRAPSLTRSRLRSEVRSLFPRRCCPARGSGATPAHPRDLKSDVAS